MCVQRVCVCVCVCLQRWATSLRKWWCVRGRTWQFTACSTTTTSTPARPYGCSTWKSSSTTASTTPSTSGWAATAPASLDEFHEVKSNASHLGDLSFLQQVSQVTMRPSETEMYDLLRCTQKWTIPYSQIYVEGEPDKSSPGGSPRFYFLALMENDGQTVGTGEPKSRLTQRCDCLFQELPST